MKTNVNGGGKRVFHLQLALLLIAIGFRLYFMHWSIEPLVSNDTTSYLDMAEGIVEGKGFTKDSEGIRTPGYPLFLSLFASVFGDNSLSFVIVAQTLLGITAAELVFLLTWQIFNNPWLSLITGLAVALDPAVAQYERYILTEGISTFLVILVFWLLVQVLIKPDYSKAIFLGLSMGYLALCRPAFAALPLLVAALVWLAPHLSDCKGISFKIVLLLLAVGVLLPGLWTARTFSRYRVSSISTLGGAQLFEHVGGFLEDIQFDTEQEKQVQSLYLKYRDLQIERTGSIKETYWSADDELMRVTGLDRASLTRLLNGMAKKGIKQAPLAYYSSVKAAWKVFYYPHLRQVQEIFPKSISLWCYVELFRLIIVFYYCFAIIFSSIVLYRQRSPWLKRHEYLMAASFVLFHYVPIVSNALVPSENDRFRIPVQPLLMSLIVWGVCWLFVELFQNNRAFKGFERLAFAFHKAKEI